MPATVIDGKAGAEHLRSRIAERTATLARQSIVPGLAVVLVGEDPASQVYVVSKTRQAEAGGWAEHPVAAGSTVRLRLRNVHGSVLAETSTVVSEAIGHPRPLARLALPHPGGEDVVMWEAEWRGPDGEVIDVERSVAALGADLSALLDLAPASVDVAVAESSDEWRVRVAHRGGPSVIGAVVHDARPWGATGRLLVRDDPRPLLPGEERDVVVRWFDVPPGQRALTIDAWNLAAVPLAAVPLAAVPLTAVPERSIR